MLVGFALNILASAALIDMSKVRIWWDELEYLFESYFIMIII